jgi:hypothetical protein
MSFILFWLAGNFGLIATQGSRVEIGVLAIVKILTYQKAFSS